MMRLNRIGRTEMTTLLLGWNSLVGFAQELPFDKNIAVQERQRVAKTVGFDQIQADDRQAGVTAPTKLSIAKVDLNADSQPDFIVVLAGSLTCGSAGCQTEVLLAKGSLLIRVLPDVNAQSIQLGLGITKGMRDLLINESSSWVWNGKKYIRK